MASFHVSAYFAFPHGSHGDRNICLPPGLGKIEAETAVYVGKRRGVLKFSV